MNVPAASLRNLSHHGGGDALDRLSIALSPAGVARAISRHCHALLPSGAQLAGVEVERVHERGDQGYVVHYRVRHQRQGRAGDGLLLGEVVGGDPQAWHSEVLCKLRKSRRGLWQAAHRGERVRCIPELGLVLRAPGLDERLPGLRLGWDTALAGRVLAATLDEPGSRVLAVQHLAQRLGKRCVLRFERAGGADVIARLASASSPKASAAHAFTGVVDEALARYGGAVRAPRPLAWSDEWAASLIEAVPGAPLLLASAGAAEGVHRAGHALARLHATGLEVPASHDRADELELLERFAWLPARIEPALAPGLRETGARVAAALEAMGDGPLVPCHRDFHEKQVLLGEHTTWLIDFDTAAMADPAIDLGNFIAHLELAGLADAGVDAAALTTAFLAGYAAGGRDADEARVRVWQRATLLRLACIQSLTTRGRPLAPSLLRKAAT